MKCSAVDYFREQNRLRMARTRARLRSEGLSTKGKPYQREQNSFRIIRGQLWQRVDLSEVAEMSRILL